MNYKSINLLIGILFLFHSFSFSQQYEMRTVITNNTSTHINVSVEIMANTASFDLAWADLRLTYNQSGLTLNNVVYNPDLVQMGYTNQDKVIPDYSALWLSSVSLGNKLTISDNQWTSLATVEFNVAQNNPNNNIFSINNYGDFPQTAILSESNGSFTRIIESSAFNCSDSLIVFAGNDTTITTSETLFLSPNVSPAGNYHCTWIHNGQHVAVDAETCSFTFNPVAPGTYTYTLVITDENDCVWTDEIIITVIDCSTNPISVFAGNDTTITTSEALFLSPSISSIGDYHCTWMYNGQHVAVDAETCSFTFIPPSPGTYTYTLVIKDENGCVWTDEIIITVEEPSNSACEAQPLSLHMVGEASFLDNTENCIVLTTENPVYQRGAVWNEFLIDLTQPFEFTASVNLGDIDTDGADGITFTLQNDVNQLNTLGNNGGYLGYTGITPSIAVEIDTWDNTGDPGTWNDITDDHIAVNLNGDALSQTTPISLGNVEDGNYHTLAVSWNPATQTLSYSLDGIGSVYTNDLINNVFNGNTQVLWGITGGTGNNVNEQIVCDMELTNCTSCQVTCGNCAQSIPNQVVNGNFELGNAGFSSDLTSSNQCTYGTYFIGHELLDKCASFDANTLDHTLGTIDGHFMIIDGNGSNATNIWSSTVNTQDGVNYNFSFWVYVPSANNGHFPSFELIIDDMVVLVIPTTAILTDNWVQYSANWVATQNGTSTLVIKQTNNGGFGKDYGIDDICFSGCREPYIVEIESSNTVTCIGDTVYLETIVTNALGAYTCNWTNNNYAGFSANQCEASFTSAIPGIYTFEVVVTDESDCEVSNFITIEVNECDTGCCTNEEAFLQAVSDGFTYSSDCDSVKLQVVPLNLNECHKVTWDWGDASGNSSIGNNSLTHAYNTQGTYTVCMLVEEMNEEGVVCWEDKYCEEIEIVCNDCNCDSIKQNATVELFYADSIGCEYLFELSSELEECVESVEWFLDGSSISVALMGGISVTHGTHTITLEALLTNGEECSIDFPIECTTCQCNDESAKEMATEIIENRLLLSADTHCLHIINAPVEGCYTAYINWGDGGNFEVISTNANLGHTYAANGTYKACLEIRLPNGEVCYQICQEIEVDCTPCSPDVKVTGVLTGSQHIIAGNKITADNVIENEANIIYQAGNTIILKPGFEVKAGANFTAIIQGSSLDCPEANVPQDTLKSRERLSDPEAVPQHRKATLKVAPNPFRSEATINYFVPQDGFIHLTIRNINGQVIDKIVDGFVTKGWQEKSYQPNYLPAGIYFLVMRTEKTIISEKVVIQN